jgi:hypothetical protein
MTCQGATKKAMGLMSMLISVPPPEEEVKGFEMAGEVGDIPSPVSLPLPPTNWLATGISGQLQTAIGVSVAIGVGITVGVAAKILELNVTH